MSDRAHRYVVRIAWDGATTGYRDYKRDHLIEADGRLPIAGSSDPAFRGDPARWSPEQLFVASIAACHKLWFLHLAAEAGIIVRRYIDNAEAVMIEGGDGGGRFEQMTLHPAIETDGADDVAVATLHERAHALCFLANSVNFPISVVPD